MALCTHYVYYKFLSGNANDVEDTFCDLYGTHSPEHKGFDS
jgi:hypothetical protein